MISVKDIDTVTREATDNEIHAACGWMSRHTVDHRHYATRVGIVRYVDLHYPDGWEGFLASLATLRGHEPTGDRCTAQYVRDHRSGMLILPGDAVIDGRGNRWGYVGLAAPATPHTPALVRVVDLAPLGVGEAEIFAYALGLYVTDLLANAL